MNVESVLKQPIPDLSGARKTKLSFRKYPLKKDGDHNDEPLIDIALYGIAGQSYYSRPNGATKTPIPEVPPVVYLRQSIVEKLADINYALQQSSEASKIFGGQVELYVNEGYRSPKLQKILYEDIFPTLIAKQQPHFTHEEIFARRDQLVARPPRDDSPSPHATGAAVDIRLRYLQPNLGFVLNSDILLAPKQADTAETTQPDYYQHHKRLTTQEKKIRDNRRAFYWIMRGALIDDDSGFAVNSSEWWHWSYGDQMWAQFTSAPEAFFAVATNVPESS
jgi:D-alanyl-D-alanine dipeptidase